MNVQELINRLQQLPKDMKVVVQHRDSGGEYYGVDEELYLMIKNGVLHL